MMSEFRIVPTDLLQRLLGDACNENWSDLNRLLHAQQPPALGGEPIKLYDMSGFGDGMVERDDGAFVYADDHRAHVAPLLADNDGLRLQCGGMQMTIDELTAERDTLKAELTRATTLLAALQAQFHFSSAWWVEIDNLLSQGPAARDGAQ